MGDAALDSRNRSAGQATATAALPPHAFFLVSAVFHYLGPAFAVLLFSQIAPLGVAWLRIATAAAIFAAWRRPWREFGVWSVPQRRTLLALGVVLGLMNVCFYLAIARLPLGTVGAIEFLGPIGLAALGARRPRNLLALGLAVAGVALLTDLRLAGEPLGFAFAFANCVLFTLYIVLGIASPAIPPPASIASGRRCWWRWSWSRHSASSPRRRPSPARRSCWPASALASARR